MIEVIIPALCTPQRLIESLAKGRRRPSLVTIVSNECDTLDTFGLEVRILRFTSDHYCYGDSDVVLRRNIGIWHARGDQLVFQDDDQVASRSMVEEAGWLLDRGPMFWGHHRYARLAEHTVDEILTWGPEMGRSREQGVNRWHGYYSAYAGMFGAQTAYLRDHLGGFDMAFLGRHSGEDQQLGKRFMTDTGMQGIWVHEPPYSWHPEEAVPRKSPRTNSCLDHDLEGVMQRGRPPIERCRRCPYVRMSGRLDVDYLIEPFRPKLVVIESADAARA